jgi:hypothetical protein
MMTAKEVGEMADKEARIGVNVRVSPAALARIDERAQKAARTRSDMLRIMLAFAETKMPAGWNPGDR